MTTEWKISRMSLCNRLDSSSDVDVQFNINSVDDEPIDLLQHDMYSPWATSMPCLFARTHPSLAYESHSPCHVADSFHKSRELTHPFSLVGSTSLNNLPYGPDPTRELKNSHFEPLPFSEMPSSNKQRCPHHLSQKHSTIRQMIARKENQPRSHYNSCEQLTSTMAYGRQRPICTFCKSNGESASVYTSHVLRDVNHEIQCPVLLAYVCPKCGATGRSAHTIKYCTALSEGERVALPTVKLLREGRSSSGSQNLFKR